VSTILIALAALQAAAAQPASPPPAAAPAARTLEALPNVKLSYYDVTGKDMKAINKSIAKNRTKAEKGSKDPVAFNWDLGAQTRTREVNGVCTIMAVEPQFKGATVELPRLTNEATLPVAVLDDWRAYQAENRSYVAQKLWFVHDRLAAMAAPLAGKKCSDAQKDWETAVAKLKADVAAFKPTPLPKAATTSSASRDPVKPIDD
jgi:predicted secreted Zn-dependent protease